MTAVVERFAPSPTGALHLGHALSALLGWEAAKAAGGTFILRMDDLDPVRCKPEFARGIEDDLKWLGLSWPEPVMFQSQNALLHHAVLDQLVNEGLVYRCYCSRAEILAATGAPQEGAENPPAYPGTCRDLRTWPLDRGHTLRLDMRKAVAKLGGAAAVRALSFEEIGEGPNGEHGTICLDPEDLIENVGDIVLMRKDRAVAYHLAVVIDDALQGVTHATRGQDLFSSTAIHRLIQALTGRPTPIYRHHRLIRDKAGQRLAKRHDALALSTLRAEGATPGDIRRRVGLD
jgi:glutamyl-Q tRNA(Asp) synthetase